MTTFSPVVPSQRHRVPGSHDLQRLDLAALGVANSPIVLLDDFRVAEMPFAPHPHAGFAAVTYVYEDALGGLRSRASTGDDVVVGPGGIVWSEAARGLLHEEVPAEPGRQLHGVQLFVKLSAANELAPARVLALQASDVPEWHSAGGDRVRVVSGTHEDVSSPLDPVEPFTLLDASVRSEIAVAAPSGHHLVLHVRTGNVTATADRASTSVGGGQSLAIVGTGEPVTLQAAEPSDVLVLGGAAIDEPVVVDGPFALSTRELVLDAIARYRRGEMGALEPSAR